ncbi:MAG TPA: hypothetical protein VF128_11505 [Gemmatimonadaceae bacterium]
MPLGPVRPFGEPTRSNTVEFDGIGAAARRRRALGEIDVERINVVEKDRRTASCGW